SSAPCRRPVMQTCAPSATKRSAVASLMPLLPPVMTATFPASRCDMTFLLTGEIDRASMCIGHPAVAAQVSGLPGGPDGVRLCRTLEHQGEVCAFYHLLVGKCLAAAKRSPAADFEGIAVELVDVQRRLALQLLASAGAVGAREVDVFG